MVIINCANMNVLWSNKGKFHKIFSTDNVNLHASGDGAAAGRCCRLCGGETSLRAFGDTYVWEGVEERYDQLLYDCFGVRVSALDCMICEWCVRQLRCTERFKALVHAAFDKPQSSNPSPIATPIRKKSAEDKSIDNKNIIELLKSKMVRERKIRRPVYQKKVILNTNCGSRRTNIQCKLCNQKYPMIVSFDSGKDFVCSRCKKNQVTCRTCKRCKAVVPAVMMKEHLHLHAKADGKGDNRQPSRIKKPDQPKNLQEVLSAKRNDAKYKCVMCKQKFILAEDLAEHKRRKHGRNICPYCKKNLKSPELIEGHIEMHRNHLSLNYYLAGPAKFARNDDYIGKIVARAEKRVH